MPAQSPLVELQWLDPELPVELQYARPHNFLGVAVYAPAMPALLRQPAAQALVAAQRALKARHALSLCVLDAWRPHAVQELMWARLPNEQFVARPERDGTGRIVAGSRHTCGVAVDVTLQRWEGPALLMPTPFDAFVPEAAPDCPTGCPEARQNMRLLAAHLAEFGFRQHRHEWWHFEWQAPNGEAIPFIDQMP